MLADKLDETVEVRNLEGELEEKAVKLLETEKFGVYRTKEKIESGEDGFKRTEVGEHGSFFVYILNKERSFSKDKAGLLFMFGSKTRDEEWLLRVGNGVLNQDLSINRGLLEDFSWSELEEKIVDAFGGYCDEPGREDDVQATYFTPEFAEALGYAEK